MACCLCFPSLCAAVFIPFLSSNFLLCLLVTSFLLAVSCVWCVFFLLFLSISYSIPFSDPLFLATLNPLGDQDHYCKSEKLPFLYFQKRQPTHTLPVGPTTDPQMSSTCQVANGTFEEQVGPLGLWMDIHPENHLALRGEPNSGSVCG